MVHVLLADDQCLSFELATKSVATEISSHLFSEETRQKVKKRTLCVYALSLSVDRSTAIIGMQRDSTSCLLLAAGEVTVERYTQIYNLPVVMT